MKKVFPIIATLILTILGSGKAYENEILFRSIPWGINLVELEKTTEAEGYSLTAISGERTRKYTISEVIYDREGTEDLKSNINLIAYSSNKRELPQVAGYIPDVIKYWFAFVPKEGILTREKADTTLYAARYELKLEDPMPAFLSFEQKLISIYGECDDIIDSERNSEMTVRYRFWKCSKKFR